MTCAPAPTLADRLLSSFPSGSYCLQSLLELAEIRESADVPTAAVECVARPRLLVNPRFVARHAETPEKLVMLVMHELHHVMLGHTRLFPRVTPLDNLVFDAVINSMLSHLFPERAHRALMVDFYSDAKFPECFLRPPAVWAPGRPVPTPPALAVPERAHLAALYRRLYTPPGPSYEELREAFAAEAGACGLPLDRLLGDHGDERLGASSAGDLESRAPVLLQGIRRIVERWPRPPVPMAGRSPHEMLEPLRLMLPPEGPHRQLVGLLRRIAGNGEEGAWRRTAMDAVEAEGPIPALGRRGAVLRSMGARPLLHRHAVPARARVLRGDRVHVYLDVSGSMSGVVPALARAVVDCGERVHRTVHLFSTRVVDVPLAQLRKGACASTHGTSIECVAEHLAAHRIRRAVLVTDGFVGRPGAVARAALGRCTLGVALAPLQFGLQNTRTDLEGLVAHWVQLNPPASQRNRP